MTEVHHFPTLKPDDIVALIAPASHMRKGTECWIDESVRVLEGWGLTVQVRCDRDQKKFYLAGDDAYRAKEINAALADPNVAAIFATRGGYGSARILPYLEQPSVGSPKIFCGFSDMTSLLLAFERQAPHVFAIHGPNLATEQFLASTNDAAENRERLHTILFSPGAVQNEAVHFLRTGYARAPIIGGCLSVLVTLLGTPFEPNFTGKIVFLEDVGEKPFRIDRMLTHLKLAGKFEGIKGLLFGEMRGCDDGANDLGEVIMDIFSSDTFPLAIGLKSGHGKNNYPVRLRRLVTLDGYGGKVSF